VAHDNVPTSSGHDAFLLGDDVPRFADAVRHFLARQESTTAR
jgi:hypothetical protein